MAEDPFGPPPTSPPVVGQPPPLPPIAPVSPGSFAPPVSPGSFAPPGGPALVGVPAPATLPRDSRRPWWGMGDILLSLPFILGVATAGTFFGLLFTGSEDFDALGDGGVPIAMLTTGLVAQQFAQGVWPLIVSKWKGLGPKSDWRLSFKPTDIGIGLGTGIAMLFVAGIFSFIFGELIGLEDASQADNTQFLDDAKGTVWLPILAVCVVLGAPIVEELFFRGLTLRAIEKRFGTVWAIFGSTIIFTLPHYSGSGWKGTVVLFAAIGSVGAVLGIVAVWRDSLGPPIVAHMLFNSLGVLVAFGVIEDPSETTEEALRLVGTLLS